MDSTVFHTYVIHSSGLKFVGIRPFQLIHEHCFRLLAIDSLDFEIYKGKMCIM